MSETDESETNDAGVQPRDPAPARVTGLIGQLIAELRDVDPQTFRFQHSSMATAPAAFRAILDVITRLTTEAIRSLDENDSQRLEDELKGLVELAHKAAATEHFAELLQVRPLKQTLDNAEAFFSDLAPYVEQFQPETVSSQSVFDAQERLDSINARVDDAAAAFDRLRTETSKLQAQSEEAEARHAEVLRKIEEQAALLEAQRDVTAISGAEDLADDYVDQADRHGIQWKLWGVILLVAAVGTGLAALGLSSARPADGASTVEAVSHATLAILIIGLMLFLVRLASRQFSVHRHLEAVSRNKAAAIGTFRRIVSSGTEPETRAAIAAILAQSVFSSDDSGFISPSGEQITMIERVVAPSSQRLTP